VKYSIRDLARDIVIIFLIYAIIIGATSTLPASAYSKKGDFLYIDLPRFQGNEHSISLRYASEFSPVIKKMLAGGEIDSKGYIIDNIGRGNIYVVFADKEDPSLLITPPSYVTVTKGMFKLGTQGGPDIRPPYMKRVNSTIILGNNLLKQPVTLPANSIWYNEHIKKYVKLLNFLMTTSYWTQTHAKRLDGGLLTIASRLTPIIASQLTGDLAKYPDLTFIKPFVYIPEYVYKVSFVVTDEEYIKQHTSWIGSIMDTIMFWTSDNIRLEGILHIAPISNPKNNNFSGYPTTDSPYTSFASYIIYGSFPYIRVGNWTINLTPIVYPFESFYAKLSVLTAFVLNFVSTVMTGFTDFVFWSVLVLTGVIAFVTNLAIYLMTIISNVTVNIINALGIPILKLFLYTTVSLLSLSVAILDGFLDEAVEYTAGKKNNDFNIPEATAIGKYLLLGETPQYNSSLSKDLGDLLDTTITQINQFDTIKQELETSFTHVFKNTTFSVTDFYDIQNGKPKSIKKEKWLEMLGLQTPNSAVIKDINVSGWIDVTNTVADAGTKGIWDGINTIFFRLVTAETGGRDISLKGLENSLRSISYLRPVWAGANQSHGGSLWDDFFNKVFYYLFLFVVILVLGLAFYVIFNNLAIKVDMSKTVESAFLYLRNGLYAILYSVIAVGINLLIIYFGIMLILLLTKGSLQLGKPILTNFIVTDLWKPFLELTPKMYGYILGVVIGKSYISIVLTVVIAFAVGMLLLALFNTYGLFTVLMLNSMGNVISSITGAVTGAVMTTTSLTQNLGWWSLGLVFLLPAFVIYKFVELSTKVSGSMLVSLIKTLILTKVVVSSLATVWVLFIYVGIVLWAISLALGIIGMIIGILTNGIEAPSLKIIQQQLMTQARGVFEIVIGLATLRLGVIIPFTPLAWIIVFIGGMVFSLQLMNNMRYGVQEFMGNLKHGVTSGVMSKVMKR